jgi:hypothetical protein
MKTSGYPAAIRLQPSIGALLGYLTAFTAQLAADLPVGRRRTRPQGCNRYENALGASLRAPTAMGSH